MARLKSLLRPLVPAPMRQWLRLRLMHMRYARMPLRQVFTEIYSGGEWGAGGLNSGSGSGPALNQPHLELVRDFIREHGIGTVVDVGCGDFRMGSQLAPAAERYIGVDIVPQVVERNRATFRAPNLEFQCANVCEEALPAGDLALVRQVLQHL